MFNGSGIAAKSKVSIKSILVLYTMILKITSCTPLGKSQQMSVYRWSMHAAYLTRRKKERERERERVCVCGGSGGL